MKLHKCMALIFAAALLSGCPEKKPRLTPPTPEPKSTVYLEEITCADQSFYCFKVVDRSDSVTTLEQTTHAISKEYFVDEDGAKFMGGINPSLSFHPDVETLIVKTRLKGKPLPTIYRPLAQTTQVKEKLTGSKNEEEVAFLFTNRRLDLPFTLIETYRGRARIADAVNDLLDNKTEVRSAEFHLQRKDTNDNTFTKLVTLNLSSSLKEENLPKELIDYLRD